MLNGTLALHDIRDVEAFVTAIVKRADLQLLTEETEDLNAYLIATTWELSLKYHAGRISFSTWAQHTLRKRIIDWQRQKYGRSTWQFKDSTHYRKRPTIVSIDEPRGHYSETGSELTYDHAAERGLHSTVTPSSGHPPRDRDASDLVRLLRTRSSDEAWRTHKDRKSLSHRAA
jgi:hypothetical protein